MEEVDDDNSGSGEVRSQLGGLDCSLPPPIKAQLGGSQLETLANSDLPCDFVASSRHFSEVPVVYALLWLLDSAAFKTYPSSTVDDSQNAFSNDRDEFAHSKFSEVNSEIEDDIFESILFRAGLNRHAESPPFLMNLWTVVKQQAIIDLLLDIMVELKIANTQKPDLVWIVVIRVQNLLGMPMEMPVKHNF